MTKKYKHSTMINWNGNLLCAIDIETTGPKVGYDDIIQVAIIPLDSYLKMNRTIMPFDISIKPIPSRLAQYRDNLQGNLRSRVARAAVEGFTYDRAAELFESWFAKLEMPVNKKIIPLAHFWPHDYAFIVEWLGIESYNLYFDFRYRDLLVAAVNQNDRADMFVEQIPYPKLDLTYICSQLKVERSTPHEALSDALATAEAYRLLVSKSTWGSALS